MVCRVGPSGGGRGEGCGRLAAHRDRFDILRSGLRSATLVGEFFLLTGNALLLAVNVLYEPFLLAVKALLVCEELLPLSQKNGPFFEKVLTLATE